MATDDDDDGDDDAGDGGGDDNGGDKLEPTSLENSPRYSKK